MSIRGRNHHISNINHFILSSHQIKNISSEIILYQHSIISGYEIVAYVDVSRQMLIVHAKVGNPRFASNRNGYIPISLRVERQVQSYEISGEKLEKGRQNANCVECRVVVIRLANACCCKAVAHVIFLLPMNSFTTRASYLGNERIDLVGAKKLQGELVEGGCNP